MEKKVVLFKLFGRIARYTEEPPGTMSMLATQFDKFLVGDKTRRERFQPVLRINSHGGAKEEAIALYSYLRNSMPNLVTVGYGFVESAAIYVFLAGAERICTPETKFFIHGGKQSFNDIPMQELSMRSRGIIDQSNLLANIIAENTTVSLKTSKRWATYGKSFYAEEALEYGFVHKISTNPIYERAECDYVYLAERW